MSQSSEIKLLIPDLPRADDLLPWLRRVDSARWYTNFGPLVRELEALLAAQWPVVPARDQANADPIRVVTLSSATHALDLGISALALRPGSDVLLPAFTFPATAAAVIRNGHRPVLADVDAESWQLTPAIARHVARQRALSLVIPVAAFGSAIDVASWDDFSAETGIPVLLDAAAAFGNQAIGQLSHAVFSLHATKPFGIGEGGLFVTRNVPLADQVKRLSNFGFAKGKAVVAGINAKLSEYGAAVALAQWQRWPVLQARRRIQWGKYSAAVSALSGVRLQGGFTAGDLPANFLVQLPVPAKFAVQAMAGLAIATRRWYSPPLQQHPAFAACSVIGPSSKAELPVTARLAEYSLGLPWHNFLQETEMSRVVEALRQLLANPVVGTDV